MRGCLTTLVVGVGLLVLAEFALTSLIEGIAAERAATYLGAENASVDLQGWPVTLRLLSDDGARATVAADNVPLEGVDAELTRLRLLLQGTRVVGGARVDVEAARFTATLTERDLLDLIGVPEIATLVAVHVTPDGLQLQIGGIGTLEATAEVVEGNLVLRTETPLGALELPVDLPGLPRGVVLEDIRFRAGALDLIGAVRGPALEELEFPLFGA
jgi:hypothetical protein